MRRRGGTSDNDQGIDIEGLLDGKPIGFQCKTGRVDARAIQEIRDALLKYPSHLDQFVILCSAHPKPAALDELRKMVKKFSTKAGPVSLVEIWGPDELIAKCGEAFLLGPFGGEEGALARHADGFVNEFKKQQIWDINGISLSKIYMDLDCVRHTWKELLQATEDGVRIDPFSESSGPRSDLLDTTLELLGQELNDFIVIQGTPGAGKSTFTLRLANDLHEDGVCTLRIRLRDLEILDDALEAIARKAVGVHRDILERILLSQPRTVLILDGWDEFSLGPSDDLSHRISVFLGSLRTSVLNGRFPNVRIVLTGRPSNAVTRQEILGVETPILTIRPFLPLQLGSYLNRLESIYGQTFTYPIEREAVIQSYTEEWSRSSDSIFSPPRGAIDVIGWPLLAHIAYRLLGECEPERQRDLILDRTGMLRCLMAFSCEHSRASSDNHGKEQILSRFQPTELRNLIQETAIAITKAGQEYINRDRFEQVLAHQMGAEERDKRVSLAHKADILIVNYFFKTTAGKLGCEFVHKAMREYAFAEALVDRLKRLARIPNSPREAQKEELALKSYFSSFLCEQWLTGEVWKYVQALLHWEVFRDNERYEDPFKFRRSERGLGIDAWCRIRDRLAVFWDEWDVSSMLSPTRTESEDNSRPVFSSVVTFTQALYDAQLGDSLFRLCAACHSVVADRLLADQGLLHPRKSFWEGHELMSIEIPHQTGIFESPDERIRFFSPFKAGFEGDERTLRGAFARINGRKLAYREELAESCDLGFICMMGAPLARISFRNCELGNCNLTESDLSGADLETSNLAGSCLRKTNLSRANLRMADFQNASFSGSLLTGADFTEANLENADFSMTKGLTVEQVLLAENWSTAKFDPDLKVALNAAGKDKPTLYGRRPSTNMP